MRKKLTQIRFIQDTPPATIVTEPSRWPGRWHEAFEREAPLHLEIGMGKGLHLARLAYRSPEINHVGLELKPDRVYMAHGVTERYGLSNVRFLVGDADKLLEAFGPGEVDMISVLFPDPWPHVRHVKHRLTHPDRLKRYQRLLKPGGVLNFRTDHESLFRYTLSVLDELGISYQVVVPVDRPLTNFEERYLTQGREVFGLLAWPNGMAESRIDPATVGSSSRRAESLNV
jgi:tRNA (guanine-N7-)-methyltransferase